MIEVGSKIRFERNKKTYEGEVIRITDKCYYVDIEKWRVKKKNAVEIKENTNKCEIDKEYIHSKGQYFTKDKSLQECIVKFIMNKPNIILEPSIGRGDLVKCVSKILNVKFDMYEIDTNIELLKCINKKEVIYGDFLKICIDKKYDTIIGNPPYVKTKNGNLYIKFINKCFNLLNDNGELVFIVPSDFLKLTSCHILLSEMINVGNFTHIYHPNKENLFEGASIDVIIFRYSKNFSKEKITMYNNCKKYLIESNGLITFNNIKYSNNKLISNYFDVSVGLVSGCENIYRNEELGNIKLLINENTYNKYIYIKNFPSENDNINNYLLIHKNLLINRKIKKYNEKNWYEWGAPRNIKKMEKFKGDKCIYIRPITREKKIAFIGKVDYFTNLIMMRPIKSCNLEKIVDYLNSDIFRENYIYSGRFKIGHRNLCNSYIIY